MTPNEAINIRYLCPHDAEAFMGLWQAYLADRNAGMPAAECSELLARLVSQNGRDAALIVEAGGRAVGFARFRIQRSENAFESAVYVQEVFILPGARALRQDGAGLAALAVRAVYATAFAMKAPAVYWLGSEHAFRTAQGAAAAPAPAVSQQIEYLNEKAA